MQYKFEPCFSKGNFFYLPRIKTAGTRTKIPTKYEEMCSSGTIFHPFTTRKLQNLYCKHVHYFSLNSAQQGNSICSGISSTSMRII